MRSGTSGLIGLALLTTACGLAACGGSNPAPSAPEQAGAAPKAAAASCQRARPGTGPTRAAYAREGSTVALVQNGADTLAYVADADDNLLHTIDVNAGTERAVTPLEGSPAQLLVLADGRVAVTLRDKNRVQILEPGASAKDPLDSLCEVPVAAEPIGIAATPDDKHIVVTSSWGKRLTSLDAATMSVAFEVPIAREPRAVLVDDDGTRAFIAHVVGAKMSVVDLTTDKHDVREIDLRAKAVERTFNIPNKLRGGCQGFALAKSVVAEDDDEPFAAEKPLIKGQAPKPPKATPKPKGRVFAPMVTVDPGELSVRSSGYGNSVALTPTEAPIVSVIDGAAERALTTSVLADGSRHAGECLLPRAAAVSPSNGALFVACLGIDAVLELDGRGIDPMRLERRRWSVPSGPTGLAVDAGGKRAVVWSQFDRELSVIDLGDGDKAGSSATNVKRVATSRKAKSEITPEIAWGRRLFHRTDDPRIARDGRACASCHPDGREDALTWSTPDGPRQTIMLAGRMTTTAPYSWMGNHGDLRAHVKETFRRLGGIGLPDNAGSFDELDALIAYLNSMRGPSAEGARADADQMKLVSRGKELFFEDAQGCATCHVGGSGTDSVKHDLGAVAASDGRGGFDTPALRFIAGTAPYFHDGRYATLEELLAGADGKMGHTLQLSRQDVTALKAYLETL
jgi:DNA-binding beta-propeller fold protein YncE/mono/diheme cytochrome c family protein